MKRKWPIDEAISKYKSGFPILEIAKQYGIAIETLRRAFQEHGVLPLPPSLARFNGHETDIRRLYLDEKKSVRKIAEIYGVDYSDLMLWMRSAGIPLRNRSEAYSARRETGSESISELDRSIADMYQNQKMSLSDIAHETGRARTWIRNRLKAQGILLRPAGSRKKA